MLCTFIPLFTLFLGLSLFAIISFSSSSNSSSFLTKVPWLEEEEAVGVFSFCSSCCCCILLCSS